MLKNPQSYCQTSWFDFAHHEKQDQHFTPSGVEGCILRVIQHPANGAHSLFDYRHPFGLHKSIRLKSIPVYPAWKVIGA